MSQQKSPRYVWPVPRRSRRSRRLLLQFVRAGQRLDRVASRLANFGDFASLVLSHQLERRRITSLIIDRRECAAQILGLDSLIVRYRLKELVVASALGVGAGAFASGQYGEAKIAKDLVANEVETTFGKPFSPSSRSASMCSPPHHTALCPVSLNRFSSVLARSPLFQGQTSAFSSAIGFGIRRG